MWVVQVGGGMYKGEFNGIFGGLLCTRQWGLRCCGGGGSETVKRNSYYWWVSVVGVLLCYDV